jgi:hypothetical protein
LLRQGNAQDDQDTIPESRGFGSFVELFSHQNGQIVNRTFHGLRPQHHAANQQLRAAACIGIEKAIHWY